MPDFSIELSLDGHVCGLDEVGRAPLAGPVVAACVYILPEKRREDIWTHVNDSKMLSRERREALCGEIRAQSFWAVGEACPREIEELNIVHASFLAMKRAYRAMCREFSLTMHTALIDGHITPEFPCGTKAVIKGDAKCVSIAAASILAKVHRDRLMAKHARKHASYGWERNVGYGTPEHLRAIDAHGVTDHHRRTFAAVRNYVEFGATRIQLELPIKQELATP